MKISHELKGQVVRFLVTTVLSASITLLMPLALHEVFLLPEKSSVQISLFVAFIFNFFVVRTFVFRSDGKMHHELIKFAFVSAGFRLGEYGLFSILFDTFGMYYLLALGIVLTFSLLVKFAVNRYFVFAKRSSKSLSRRVTDEI